MSSIITIQDGVFSAEVNLRVAAGIEKAEQTRPNGTKAFDFFPMAPQKWKKLMQILSKAEYENQETIERLPGLMDELLKEAKAKWGAQSRVYQAQWKDPEYWYNHRGDKTKQNAIKRSNARLLSEVEKAKSVHDRTQKMIDIYINELIL